LDDLELQMSDSSQCTRTSVFKNGLGMDTLTANYNIRVEPTSDLYSKAIVKLYAKASDGTVHVYRLRVRSRFTPSTAIEKTKAFSSNARMSNGTSSMIVYKTT